MVGNLPPKAVHSVDRVDKTALKVVHFIRRADS